MFKTTFCTSIKNSVSREPSFSSKPSTKQILSFNPPITPSYTIKELPNQKDSLQTIQFESIYYIPENIPKWLDISFYHILNKKTKKGIVLLHIINNSHNKNIDHNTIVYFHCNSSDLGMNFPFLIDLSLQMKSDIISFDYSGYGRSDDKYGVDILIEDANLVKQYIKTKEIKHSNIILFGRDIGAIPSSFLGANIVNGIFLGLILLSPLFGGAINEKFLKEIKCPTFVIHGKKDPSFLYTKLSELCKSIITQIEWYPKARSADDLIVNFRKKFYLKLRDFCNQIKNGQSNIILNNITNSGTSSYISEEGKKEDKGKFKKLKIRRPSDANKLYLNVKNEDMSYEKSMEGINLEMSNVENDKEGFIASNEVDDSY